MRPRPIDAEKHPNASLLSIRSVGRSGRRCSKFNFASRESLRRDRRHNARNTAPTNLSRNPKYPSTGTTNSRHFADSVSLPAKSQPFSSQASLSFKPSVSQIAAVLSYS